MGPLGLKLKYNSEEGGRRRGGGYPLFLWGLVTSGRAVSPRTPASSDSHAGTFTFEHKHEDEDKDDTENVIFSTAVSSKQ